MDNTFINCLIFGNLIFKLSGKKCSLTSFLFKDFSLNIFIKTFKFMVLKKN